MIKIGVSKQMFLLLKTFIASVLFLYIILASNMPSLASNEISLATHEMSLEKRQPDVWVNSVFKDNILLNLAYLKGEAKKGTTIDWDRIREPFVYEFTLQPNEVFAYHEDVLPEYQGKITRTTNAHFNGSEGFKSDGYLMGDGVCHLASLMYWAAKDAGLKTHAPTNHSFADIPQVPDEYGVSIYNMPGSASTGASQNLYITNNTEQIIIFRFEYDGVDLRISVVK